MKVVPLHKMEAKYGGVPIQLEAHAHVTYLKKMIRKEFEQKPSPKLVWLVYLFKC